MTRSVRFYLLLLVLSLLSFEASSNEQTKLLIEGPQHVIQVGDVTKLSLTLWPIEELKEINLKDLEGKKLGGVLYILTVGKATISSNNEQALVAKLSGVFLEATELPEKVEIGEQEIQLLKRSLELEGEVAEIKEIHVFKKDRTSNFYLFLLLALIVFVLVSLGYAYRNHMKKTERLKAMQQDEEFWRCKLKAAKTRSELEELYAKRKVWTSVLRPPSGNVSRFSDCIESIQYKKEWTKEEYEEVAQCLNELIRRTLV